jgi:hypothetical protein
MAVDSDVTPQFIVQLLSDPSVRPQLAEILNAVCEDMTFPLHVPQIRSESIALGGDEIAGTSLLPIPQWDGQVETLPAFLEQVWRHVNRSRTGSA